MSEVDLSGVKRVGVVGAGTMGAGIAQLFLAAGYPVDLFDLSDEQRARAAERIRVGLDKMAQKGRVADPAAAFAGLDFAPHLMALRQCDWILEAILEEVEAKEEVFRTLGRLTADGVVLASNTSSISITRLGAVSDRPERVIGMHFFNPPPVMQLVEVIPGLRTDPAVVATAQELARRLGKTPVVAKDRAGFLSNRILAPMLNEAICALEEGVGTPEDIDQVMKLGMRHPMGPLELADFIGLDVLLAILNVLHSEIGDPKYRPCPLLKKHVEAGWLGRKSGRGFYSYPAG